MLEYAAFLIIEILLFSSKDINIHRVIRNISIYYYSDDYFLFPSHIICFAEAVSPLFPSLQVTQPLFFSMKPFSFSVYYLFRHFEISPSPGGVLDVRCRSSASRDSCPTGTHFLFPRDKICSFRRNFFTFLKVLVYRTFFFHERTSYSTGLMTAYELVNTVIRILFIVQFFN